MSKKALSSFEKWKNVHNGCRIIAVYMSYFLCKKCEKFKFEFDFKSSSYNKMLRATGCSGVPECLDAAFTLWWNQTALFTCQQTNPWFEPVLCCFAQPSSVVVETRSTGLLFFVLICLERKNEVVMKRCLYCNCWGFSGNGRRG